MVILFGQIVPRYKAIASMFLQKKVIRTITHSQFMSHSPPLLAKCNTLTVYDIHNLQTCVFMYMCKQKLLPTHFVQDFPLNANIHSYSTRSHDDFHIPKVRTSLAQSNLIYNGPITWNKLPCNLKSCNSLNQFKRNMKKYLILNYTP